MKHWKLAVAMIGLLGCQAADPDVVTEAETSTVEQLAVGSFCGVGMPPSPFYQPGESIPTAGPNAAFVVVQDWTSPGNWIAGLGDLSSGKVVWSRRADPNSISAMLGRMAGLGRINVPNPPPPPWPIGTKFQARFIMEVVLQTIDVHKLAGANASACP